MADLFTTLIAQVEEEEAHIVFNMSRGKHSTLEGYREAVGYIKGLQFIKDTISNLTNPLPIKQETGEDD